VNEARDHEQRLEARQGGDDVFDQAVGKIFLRGIVAHIVERQHGDRRFYGKRERWRLRRRGQRCRHRALRGRPNPPHLHRAGNVLQDLLPKVVAANVDLAAEFPMNALRQTDTAGLGEVLDPRGDIDAVAENIIVVEDNVADMDADAELDPLLGRQDGILLCHLALDLDGAAHRVDGTGELHQHAVAGGLDDAAAMRGEGRVNNGFLDGD
jgi:hypothetical protein